MNTRLPSWNRRGGPKGRGGSEVIVLDYSDTESFRVGYHPGWSPNFCIMKKTLVGAALIFLSLGISSSQDLNVKWIHGSEPCTANTDVPFQVHAYNDDTYILRENKCINYQGPFIYLLFGQDKVFMQDTGAAPAANSESRFRFAKRYKKLSRIGRRNTAKLKCNLW